MFLLWQGKWEEGALFEAQETQWKERHFLTWQIGAWEDEALCWSCQVGVKNSCEWRTSGFCHRPWRRSKAIDMGLFEPAQAQWFASGVNGNTTCNSVGLSGSKAKVVLIDDEAAAKSRLETETCLQGEMVSEQDWRQAASSRMCEFLPTWGSQQYFEADRFHYRGVLGFPGLGRDLNCPKKNELWAFFCFPICSTLLITFLNTEAEENDLDTGKSSLRSSLEAWVLWGIAEKRCTISLLVCDSEVLRLLPVPQKHEVVILRVCREVTYIQQLNSALDYLFAVVPVSGATRALYAAWRVGRQCSKRCTRIPQRHSTSRAHHASMQRKCKLLEPRCLCLLTKGVGSQTVLKQIWN